MEYRARLLRTVNQAAEVLLTAKEQDTMIALKKGMEIVGLALGVDRVQIWRNEIIDGELHFVMRYEWLSEIGKQKIEVPIGLHFPYSKIPDWYNRFLDGGHINSPIPKLPPNEAAFLGYYQMAAIVIIPMFLDKEFIGFFSVDDCINEKVFTDDEMEMLASTGLMFASVFHRTIQANKLNYANTQMEEALAHALSASRAKTDFLATMSHEMRTPMNTIIGMTAIAKKAVDQERQNYALERVEEAAHHLLGVINAVLDMSKIEANKVELQCVEFDLQRLLKKVVTLVNFRIEEKMQKFVVSVNNDVPLSYKGDDQRLTQVIVNLLSNAVIYTPEEGSIALDVSLVSREDKDNICILRFAIEDDGIGISKEAQTRLFNMFEQADGSSSRKYGGTGLGLTISKHLVELMGGEIYVESELGKGSIFTFTVELQIIETKKPIDFNIPTELDNFTGKRILLAEDIEINREIIISQLEGTGLEIDIAINGREAVEILAANPSHYDLVFMDMRMPEMDGLQATRKIRALEATKNIPIIAMTANVFMDDIEQCILAGMNEHIGKPIDMSIVFEKLRKYL